MVYSVKNPNVVYLRDMAYPLVSILMPVFNEERYIVQALESLLAQDYPNFEILIIDGGSTDRTREIVVEYQEDNPQIRLLHNPGKWQSRGLNIGLQASKGDIIARMDGHTVVSKDYITNVVKYLMENPEISNVGGLVRADAETPMGKTIALAYRSWFAVPSKYRISTQNAYVDMVFMGAWRRETFEQVGMWNELLKANEDYEHNYRIRKMGGKVLLATELETVYFCRETLKELWLQYYAYGRHKFEMLRYHPESILLRQVVAPLFVLCLFIGGFISFFVPIIGFLWVAMVALYLFISISHAYKLGEGQWKFVWRLPLIFAAIHIAWGLGFWRAMGENLIGKSTIA